LIRHIYTAKFKPGVTEAQVDEWWAALQKLSIEGMRSFTGGRDLGLREGNADFALTADFDDADAWRRYDEDEEHNRIRRELAAPMTAEMGRIQIEAPEQSQPAAIRNVALFWSRSGVSDREVDEVCSALNQMKIEGLQYFQAGRDLGLKEGNAAAAVIADLHDADAYQRYDADAEHNRIRRELVAPMAERLMRVQFRA
jgi:stress responsive alpha/beta barrel protein